MGCERKYYPGNGEKITMKTIAIFNNKGGVGKTSLAYHISWMLSELEHSTLLVDLDPQANLTGMCLNEAHREQIINNNETVFSAIDPIIQGTGDIGEATVIPLNDHLKLLPGDLRLSLMEADFASSWPACLDQNSRAFRVTTAFNRLIHGTEEKTKAKLAIIDIGPNLGAINRAALISSDYVIFPLSPDLFSYQGLKNAGEFLNRWRKEWEERKNKKPENLEFSLPTGEMKPLGYIMMRHSVRLDRPVKAYSRWMQKMPEAYNKYVLKQEQNVSPSQSGEHPDMFAHLKDYRSLMQIAQEKNKPMFLLKPGDGAIGSHFQAVQACYKDFKELTKKIVHKIENLTQA